MNSRTVLIVLLICNALVLLGQVWPEGAPPFAREVSVAVLVANLLAFGRELGRRRAKPA